MPASLSFSRGQPTALVVGVWSLVCGGWPTDGWSGCVMSEPSQQRESNRHDAREKVRSSDYYVEYGTGRSHRVRVSGSGIERS
ncbi:hypothetical protein LZ32DRAFT_598037 [Colletotrichum eremochloae]|nr:hypothetical protein LZ32DRAFT_598037 [Colletotrichum eremochloae]